MSECSCKISIAEIICKESLKITMISSRPFAPVPALPGQVRILSEHFVSNCSSDIQDKNMQANCGMSANTGRFGPATTLTMAANDKERDEKWLFIDCDWMVTQQCHLTISCHAVPLSRSYLRCYATPSNMDHSHFQTVLGTLRNDIAVLLFLR